MKFGISVPNFGDYADARSLAAMARDAERAGWDGFFIWDHISWEAFGPPQPMADPWVALTAIACATERIRIGTMVTPVARRRPWKLARETATLDVLSGGRLTLGVGLGFPPDTEFARFGEEPDDRTRGEKLDEALDVLCGLWTGEPFEHHGTHYDVGRTTFLPRPAQSPRVPIIVAGMWPNRAPMRRAARWDGVFPIDAESGGARPLSPDELRDVIAYVTKHRTTTPAFDVYTGGESEGGAAGASAVAPYEAAGATWWIEGINGFRGPFDEMRERVRQGPPSG